VLAFGSHEIFAGQFSPEQSSRTHIFVKGKSVFGQTEQVIAVEMALLSLKKEGYKLDIFRHRPLIYDESLRSYLNKSGCGYSLSS